MDDKERPGAPVPDEESPDTPAAVQWMMQQAAAGQSAAILPPGAGALAVPGLAPGLAEAALAARDKRVADALRGNDRLTEGLDGDAAAALMDWGLDMGRIVVRDTAGQSDAAAEDILQPRVRAVRRLMMAVAQATRPAAEVDPAGWLEQAIIALGDHMTPVDGERQEALRQEWLALSGRPRDQIAVLRRFIDPPGGFTF